MSATSQVRSHFLLLTCLATTVVAQGTDSATLTGRLLKLFQPQVTTLVAIAPDGRHLAYALREIKGGEIEWSIVIADMTNYRDIELPIREEPRSYPGANIRRLPPIMISYLQWVSSTRLAYYNGWAVRTVDSDGKNDRRIADQYDLGVAIAGRGGSGGWFTRQIHVENRVPDNSGTLVASVFGAGAAATYLLDANTGTWKSLGEFSEGGSYWRDMQGRPRINQSDPIVIPPRFSTQKGPPDPPFLNPSGLHYFYRDGLARELRDPLFGLRHWDKLEDIVGRNPGVVFNYKSDEFYSPRAIPIGFGKDPNILYYSSDFGRNTRAIYKFDLHSKQSSLVAADPAVDLADLPPIVTQLGFTQRNLVFDRSGNLAGIRVNSMKPHTIWVDPAVAAFQGRIDARFPDFNMEIADWDDAHARFLVSSSSPSDPGGYWVADASDLDNPKAILSRTETFPGSFNPSSTFEFDSPAGIHLTGTITQPTVSRVKPAPAIIYCHNTLGRASGGFNRITQALSIMGFVVVEVNYRGSAGFGAALRDGLKQDPDGPVEDILATLEWVKANYPIDQKRVALYGDGLGGYFAIRALELHPDAFRAGAARQPSESINDWIVAGGSLVNPRRALLGDNSSRYASESIVKHADDLSRPVLLISNNSQDSFGMSTLAFSLRNKAVKPETMTRTEYTNPDFSWMAEPELYFRIGEFLNRELFKYDVEIGELKEVK